VGPGQRGRLWLHRGARYEPLVAAEESAGAWTLGGSAREQLHLSVLATQGGLPGGLFGACIAYHHQGVDQDKPVWIGWDGPGVLTGSEVIAWDDSTTLGYQTPSICSLSDGRLVVVFDEPLTTSRRQVRMRRWLPTEDSSDGGDWEIASTTIYSEPAANVAAGAHPVVLALPDGRLLCFHFMHLSADLAQIWAWSSLDGGDTWAQTGAACLQYAFVTSGATIRQVSAAYGAGQILLWIGYERAGVDSAAHYASRDLGASFSFVAHGLTLDDWTRVEWARDQFVVYSRGAIAGLVARTGDAFEAMGSVTPDRDADTTDGDGLALAVDESGNLYALSSEDIAVSGDAGSTWGAVTYGAESYGDGGMIPRAACWHRGRIVAVGNQEGGGLGLVARYFGGYTDVTAPIGPATTNALVYVAQRQPLPWKKSWDATGEKLEDHGVFVANNVGVPVHTLGFGVELISTGVGVESRTEYTETGLAEYTYILAEHEVQVFSGTARLVVRVWDGTDWYMARLSLTTTTATLADYTGADSASEAAAGGRWCLRLCVRPETATAWIREITDGGALRQWTQIGPVELVGTTAAADPLVRRTVEESSLVQSYSLRCRVAAGDAPPDETQDPSEGFTNPDMLQGRPISGTEHTYLTNGVGVKLAGGPIFGGEAWTAECGGDNPIANLFPETAPSPQIYATFENSDDSYFFVSTGSDDSDTEDLEADVIGIYLDWAVHSATLKGYDGSSLVTLGVLETSYTVAFARGGQTLRPPESGSATERYWAPDELVGGWVVLDPGGAATVHRIVGNTGGNWNTGTIAEHRPVIRIADTSPTDPTSGSMRVIPPRSVHVVPLLGDRRFSSIWLVWNDDGAGVPEPPWGEVIARKVVAGPLWAPGWKLARDWSHVREAPGTLLEELPSGATWSRTRTGRTRRVAELTWTEGYDPSALGLLGGSPDYWRGALDAAGQPIAARGDPGALLQGLLDRTQGAATPIVWIPQIPVQDGVWSGLNHHAGGAIYGRIVSSTARVEGIVGRPHGPGLQRGPRLTIAEEL
jgi:hypothetical protein